MIIYTDISFEEIKTTVTDAILKLLMEHIYQKVMKENAIFFTLIHLSYVTCLF